jgi:hypothetical protein
MFWPNMLVFFNRSFYFFAGRKIKRFGNRDLGILTLETRMIHSEPTHFEQKRRRKMFTCLQNMAFLSAKKLLVKNWKKIVFSNNMLQNCYKLTTKKNAVWRAMRIYDTSTLNKQPKNVRSTKRLIATLGHFFFFIFIVSTLEHFC